jgi:LmbE family N-acetylglucosaminyl deacetylase
MKLLVAIAHPDDESFGCGSVLARAVANGHEAAVLCATRGEAGESRIVTDDLASLREAELHDAARILGVATVRVLDYADSGMAGDPGQGTLAGADPSKVAQDVRSVIDELRPDVVVTLDASDGHRDHAAIREATLAAVDTATHAPAATYLWCLARSSMARWAAHVRETGQGDAYLALGELGTPDHDITLVVDVAAHLPLRWAAIRAHASQASPYDDLPPALQREFLAVDRLRLARGRHGVGPL